MRGDVLRSHLDGSLADSMVPADLLKHFPSFGASALVSDEIAVRHDGARFDANAVQIAITILRLINMLRDDLPRTVCDIGGGIGATALAWLRNSAHRPDRVVIVDLPETLIFADALLRHELGKVHYAHDRTPLDPAIPAKVILCPVSNSMALHRLQFDLVTNTLSMQEMTDDWVDWYMLWLDEQNCRYFYSANHFGMALGKMLEGRNAWSPRPSAKWRLRRFWISDADPDRPGAVQLFKKTEANVPPINDHPARLDEWLKMLDRVRMSRRQETDVLQRALLYGLELLPIPKETWHLARALSATGDPWAVTTFARLSRIRTGT